MLNPRGRCGSVRIRTHWPGQKPKMHNHELSHYHANVRPSLSVAQTHSVCSSRTLTAQVMLLFFMVTLLLVSATLTQTVATDELYIQPTPALHMFKEDLTTVVLVNNANNVRSDHVGHHLNIRPEVGLLTSTARTFIQEGVTTEYATQVVGTTLDSGRLYAQYLRKSSRVLYNNGLKQQQTQQGVVLPTVVTSWVGDNLELQTKALLENHNDLYNADLPDWQEIDDRLLHEDGNVFVGNTDFARLNERNSNKKQNQLPLNDENKVKHLIITTVFAQNVTSGEHGATLLLDSTSKQKQKQDIARLLDANKVLPVGDLATYTVRNHFSPSGFPPETVNEHAGNTNANNPNRTPKLYYQQLMHASGGGKSALRKDTIGPHFNNRQLSTTTYYGFADFTTVVGDSVIVFSPSTATQNLNLGHVTSIKGEATLGDVGDNVHGATIFAINGAMASEVEQMQVATNFPHLSTLLMLDVNAHKASSANVIDIASEIQSQVTEEILQTHTSVANDEELRIMQTKSTDNNIDNFSAQSSSIVEETLKLSRPSNEEIAEIYASLSRAATSRASITTTMQTVAPTYVVENSLLEFAENTNEQPSIASNTVQLVANDVATLQSSEVMQHTSTGLAAVKATNTSAALQILGGATTVFFEDDPFANFVESFMSTATKPTEVLYMENTAITTQAETDLTTTEEYEDTGETTTVEPKILESTTPVEYKVENGSSSSNDSLQHVEDVLQNDVQINVQEINSNNDIAALGDCIRTSQIFLTQIAKTITQLNTLRASAQPGVDEPIQISKIETLLLPTFDIIETTKLYCIKPQATIDADTKSTAIGILHENEKAAHEEQLEKSRLDDADTTTLAESIVEEDGDDDGDNDADADVDTVEITTVSANISDEEISEHTTTIIDQVVADNNNNNETEVNDGTDRDVNADDAIYVAEDDSGEEIELIYKTLYTTYTYLTTFFNEDSSTSISSHTEVFTNIVTSTLESGSDETVPATLTKKLLSTESAETGLSAHDHANNEHKISSSSKFILSTELESILRVDEHDMDIGKTGDVADAHTATVFLDDKGETEIMSRTEVYTNYVTNTITPTAVLESNKEQIHTIDSSVSSSTELLSNQATDTNNVGSDKSSQLHESAQKVLNEQRPVATPVFPNEQLGLSNYNDVTLVTDIRSSSSNGKKHIINQQQEAFFDQISSESNTDEIRPSAILLLQTSFTTFTYYTTMYNNDATNVISRLETITNVVTETLQPTKTESVEEVTLPITYFTTFTYWTKLAKNGEITTLSREETISNVVTPSTIAQTAIQTAVELSRSENIHESTQSQTVIVKNDNITGVHTTEIVPNDIRNSSINNANSTALLEPTTYYTTYTYYTTSYDVDRTITDSRYETVTHVVTPTRIADTIATDIIASATLLTDALPLAVNNGNTPALEISPSVLFYDYKRIIDADGVSTLHYLTEILPTTATDGMQSNFTSSTSSLLVDETKKALQSSSMNTANTDASSGRQYKTGLVRLIEGTRIGNHTTTLYQSKVIGTFIENRYAQIIESTSSFIFETNTSPMTTDVAIEHTLTVQAKDPIEATLNVVVPTLQNSIVDNVSDSPTIAENGKEDDENFDGDVGNEDEDEDDDGDGNGNKARLSYQSRKRTFTPVIRPFASRNRPQFAPKKKNTVLSSATIITRHDFTPTITATPALKQGGRFSTRKGGFTVSPTTTGASASIINSSSRRPFGRPIKPTSSSGSNVVSNTPAIVSGSGYNGGRNRLTSSTRLQSSTRRAGVLVRPSSVSGLRPGFSSAYNGNSRTRIKSTSLAQSGHQNEPFTEGVTISTSETSGEESTTPELQTSFDENDEGFADAAHRNSNPLLRLRRPLNRPAGFTPASQRAVNGGAGISTGAAVSQRRNPLISRAKTATTVTSTTTTTQSPRSRSLQRPQINNTLGRTRPQNSLFPPRGLLQRQINQETNEAKENKKEDSAEGNVDIDDDSEYDDEDEEDNEDDVDGDNNRRRRSNSKQNKQTTGVGKPLATDRNEIKHIHKSTKSRRVRREAETPLKRRSSFRNRFRHPKLTSAATTADERNYNEESESELSPPTVTTATTRARTSGRFAPRYNLHHTSTQVVTAPATTTSTGNHRAIRPTRPTNGRAQFTLREKDTTTTTQKGLTRPGTSHFRRPQTAASSRRSSAPTTSNRRKAYNGNNVNLSQDTAARSTSTRARTNLSRTRTTVRGRSRNDYNVDPVVIPYDGTITITYVIPAEVTIPVINGKVTEYKNVVTAKTSTEILSPQQYTSFVGSNGQTMLALTREDSSVNFGGATEVTQYVLHESPTTTVIFTPTTIRGRKTSFSHIIPSTIYSVENVISTTQPQISANAPLANILLSQLLLGNIGLPPANPLLGALGAAATPAPNPLGAGSIIPQVPPTPVTEYRTHTSTYVTTVFEGMSTVLPITFQGKKILTTVYDTTAQTITATEFVTDTIVTTPTQQPQALPQVNSLLIQQLLLQQQLQPHIEQPQLPIPILQTTGAQLLLSDNLQELDMNHIKISNENDNDIAFNEENMQNNKTGRKKARKSSKAHKRKHQSYQDETPESSSIITLYVSGRRPGEFSTILSTVALGYDSTIHKRQAPGAQQHTAKIDTFNDFYVKDGSEHVPTYLLPELQDDNTEQQIELNLLESVEYNAIDQQTQSLESIVGDVSKWIAKSTTHTYDNAVTLDQLPVNTRSLQGSGAPVSESSQIGKSSNFKVLNIVTPSTKPTISIFGRIDCQKCESIEVHSGSSNEHDESKRNETVENGKDESKVVVHDDEAQEMENVILIYLGDKTKYKNIQRNPYKKCDKSKSTSFNCKELLHITKLEDPYYIYQIKSKQQPDGIDRSKRSVLVATKSERIVPRQYQNVDGVVSEMSNYVSFKNNTTLGVNNSGRRGRKLLVRRRNRQMLDLSSQQTTVQPSTHVAGRKIIVIRKQIQKQDKQTETAANNMTVSNVGNGTNFLPVTLPNTPNTNSTICTTNLVYTSELYNFTTSDKTRNHTLQSNGRQNSNIRSPGRIVKKCVNRKLRHFSNNEPNPESTPISVTVDVNSHKSEIEMTSENSQEAAAPTARSRNKRRRKKKNRRQSQRNQNQNIMQIEKKYSDKVVAVEQENSLPQSFFTQQSKMILPTMSTTIFNDLSETPTILSSKQESDERNFSVIHENTVQPTSVLNIHMGHITQTSLSYEIVSSIQYETVVRTRTYTYIVDRVHDDQHHYIESSTLVRKETQIEPQHFQLTHTLTHVLVQKVVTPTAMPSLSFGDPS